MAAQKQKQNIVKIEIETKTIIQIAAVIAGILLAVYLRAVLLVFLVSFIAMAALKPAVDFLVSKKMNRNLAVILVVFMGMVCFGALISIISIPLIRQLGLFIENFPAMVTDIVGVLRDKFPVLQEQLTPEKVDTFLSNYQGVFLSLLGGIGTNVWKTLETTYGLFGALISTFTVVMLAVYMLIEHDNIVATVSLLFQKKKRKKAIELLKKVERKIGAWLRGQIILCLIVGLVTWLTLSIMGVKYAAPLGVLAGILEIIPGVGPMLSAIPIVITGFSTSTVHGVGAFAAMFVIQQLENAILVPFVMKRAVGLNPVVVLLAIWIGMELFNVVGAIVAVPVAGIFAVLVTEYLASNGIIIEKGIGKGDI